MDFILPVSQLDTHIPIKNCTRVLPIRLRNQVHQQEDPEQLPHDTDFQLLRVDPQSQPVAQGESPEYPEERETDFYFSGDGPAAHFELEGELQEETNLGTESQFETESETTNESAEPLTAESSPSSPPRSLQTEASVSSPQRTNAETDGEESPLEEERIRGLLQLGDKQVLSNCWSRIISLPNGLPIELTGWCSADTENQDWHQRINVIAREPGDADGDSRVAQMFGCWIDREAFKLSHSEEGEDGSIPDWISALQDNSLEEIFENGLLRTEFLAGEACQGSGRWGPELNSGRIFWIELVFVQKAYRGLGLGDTMFRLLLRDTQIVKPGGFKFAFVKPGIIDGWVIARSPEQQEPDLQLERAKLFYRKRGFRRIGTSDIFARATGKWHMSRRGSFGPERDFDGTELLLASNIEIEDEGTEDWGPATGFVG